MTGATRDSCGGALHGTRVIEIASMGPAPFCGMMLSDFGATVTRIERPGAAERRGGSAITGRGRTTIELDLKTRGGRAELLQRVAEADILIEGLRPGAMERLGAGPTECLEVNPQLVYGRVTGWGQTGPLAETAGHDITYLAVTGALFHMGHEDAPPVPPLNLVGDYGGGGLLLAFGVLAARDHARRTGEGQVVDAAMVDGASLLMSYIHGMRACGQWRDQRGANILDGAAPFYRTYPCADGAWVAVGAIEDRFWTILLDGLGIDPGALPDRGDPANWPTISARVGAVIATRSRDDWATRFAHTDACLAPVLTMGEAAEWPPARERGAFGPAAGLAAVPAPAPRLSRTPARARFPVTGSD